MDKGRSFPGFSVLRYREKTDKTKVGLDEKLVWTLLFVLLDVLACSFWSACKSFQHHQTLEMNSSLACQNAFPLPSTPARVYRDLLCNGLIVRGIKDSTAPSPGVLWTVNFRFRQPRAQGHEPPALLKNSVASHVWNWLTCLNLLYLCSVLVRFERLKPCKAMWLKTYMCRGNKELSLLF